MNTFRFTKRFFEQECDAKLGFRLGTYPTNIDISSDHIVINDLFLEDYLGPTKTLETFRSLEFGPHQLIFINNPVISLGVKYYPEGVINTRYMVRLDGRHAKSGKIIDNEAYLFNVQTGEFYQSFNDMPRDLVELITSTSEYKSAKNIYQYRGRYSPEEIDMLIYRDMIKSGFSNSVRGISIVNNKPVSWYVENEYIEEQS